ncbi:hypothetical protein TRFO_12652 [Tritrichomonas foetus]|uniref:Uncharacterized protein n=1 Tax=Tritrichomonas foetus TaxID=1144522 RepID=A0A1J4L5B4_9EUKA|nr:hypothetical protein TRFO_12652 [Tritrichomonas foetus]|eukprot:OHT17126.1 hypothetical protein TRFO_12652 [Tritrichomonas foetus]
MTVSGFSLKTYFNIGHSISRECSSSAVRRSSFWNSFGCSETSLLAVSTSNGIFPNGVSKLSASAIVQCLTYILCDGPMIIARLNFVGSMVLNEWADVAMQYSYPACGTTMAFTLPLASLLTVAFWKAAVSILINVCPVGYQVPACEARSITHVYKFTIVFSFNISLFLYRKFQFNMKFIDWM